MPARLIRGETLTLRTREYVQAVRVMGGSGRRIVIRHIIPNTIGTIMVNATFQVADAILLLAALGFLGLGVPAPLTDWGSMLSDGVNYADDGYWWQIIPDGRRDRARRRRLQLRRRRAPRRLRSPAPAPLTRCERGADGRVVGERDVERGSTWLTPRSGGVSGRRRRAGVMRRSRQRSGCQPGSSAAALDRLLRAGSGRRPGARAEGAQRRLLLGADLLRVRAARAEAAARRRRDRRRELAAGFGARLAGPGR